MTQAFSQSRLDTRRAIPIFVLVFVDVLGLTVILPLLHLYAAAYGATPVQIGLVAAAFPLAQLIGVPIMGALSDRFGRKPLLLISQITTCASFVMLGLAGSLKVIILSRLIDGLFGANIATAQAALSDITDDRTRTQGLGLTGAAFGLGFIFGPIISLLSLEIGGSLSVPALSAAGYSFLSILLTWFVFEETLPAKQRSTHTGRRIITPFAAVQYLFVPGVGLLLVLMFAQQLIFFGFESLLGLFTLSRLGILGQTNALIFIIIGITLVTIQVRYIGHWSQKYGEARLVQAALTLLSAGLILMALTPERPHILYVQRVVEYELQEQAPSNTEAILGNLNIRLPDETKRGFSGILWVFIVVIPLSVGAALIRPSLNSLITKQVKPGEFGAILGVSAAFVSAANAAAPLIGGWLFQQYGSTIPFLLGGILMGMLAVFTKILQTHTSFPRGKT